jgi:hypothetical protein
LAPSSAAQRGVAIATPVTDGVGSLLSKLPRPFLPAVPGIRPQLGPETLVRRYTVLVPVEEIKAGVVPRQIATADDLQKLQLMLVKHFGGVTLSPVVPGLIGRGARDPRKPKQTLELNKHAYFTVYAAAIRASDESFLALPKELADALVEGVILVERQDVTIL